ncbi:MAG: hypothetical protein OEZ39_02150 [Gammaproteobacteria bacterium]|nr:hypothetical protein [Gammaproteobacteria bacterium]MDH5650656.1 hypothetical protein [Gammaproteobacteria bacterium]
MKTRYLILIGSLLLTACGGGGGGGGGGGTSGGITIHGRLLAPDHATPIAGATVFSPAQLQAQAYAATVAPAAGCPAPAIPNQAYTCTDADGRFALTVPAESTLVPLILQKGAFSTSAQVDLINGQTTLGDISLPADPAQGAGRFAVIQGAFDRMEDILAKLGMGRVDNITHQLIPGTETFALFADTDPLFMDADADGRADIFNFDVVFINCGQSGEDSVLATHRQTLHDYVMQGGVLYITDQAYDFLEQVFPAYIDFYGDDGLSAAVAEAPDLAETGAGGISVNADILDSRLRDWLNNVSCSNGPCLTPDGTVTIQGFLGNWAVMHGSHPGHAAAVTEWVRGDVSWFDPFSMQTVGPVQKPLTVTLQIGLGKVLYSSYHTDELSFTSGFHPQERILQYLIFEL